jgi:hypothetical protein
MEHVRKVYEASINLDKVVLVYFAAHRMRCVR